MATFFKVSFFLVEKASVPINILIRRAADRNDRLKNLLIQVARSIRGREKKRRVLWNQTTLFYSSLTAVLRLPVIKKSILCGVRFRDETVQTTEFSSATPARVANSPNYN